MRVLFAILALPAAKSLLLSGLSEPISLRTPRLRPESLFPASGAASHIHGAPGTPLPAEAPPTGFAHGPAPPRARRLVLSAPAAGRVHPRRSEVTDGAGLRRAEGRTAGGGGTEERWRPRPDIGAASPNPGAGADEAARLGPAVLRNRSWGDPGGGAWPCCMPAPRLE